MDIVAAVFLGAALISVGVMAGVVYTDRRDRKQALTRVEEGEQRVRAVHTAAKQEVAALVATINETHNGLVKTVATIDAKVESLGNRVSAAGKASAEAQTLGGKNPFAPR